MSAGQEIELNERSAGQEIVKDGDENINTGVAGDAFQDTTNTEETNEKCCICCNSLKGFKRWIAWMWFMNIFTIYSLAFACWAMFQNGNGFIAYQVIMALLRTLMNILGYVAMAKLNSDKLTENGKTIISAFGMMALLFTVVFDTVSMTFMNYVLHLLVIHDIAEQFPISPSVFFMMNIFWILDMIIAIYATYKYSQYLKSKGLINKLFYYF